MNRLIPFGRKITGDVVPDYLFSNLGVVDSIVLNLTSKVGLKYTIESNIEVIIGELPSAGNIGRATIELTGGGDYAITWDPNIFFPQGSPPSLSTGGKTDRLFFYCEDGAHVECYVVGLDISRT